MYEIGAIFSGFSTLILTLVALAFVFIVFAILRILKIVELSRFGGALLFILAAIPVTLSLLLRPTSFQSRAGPEGVRIVSMSLVDRQADMVAMNIVTTKPVFVTVRFSTQKDNLNVTALEDNPVPPKTVHRVVIRGLAPGTTYFFQVEADGKPLGEVTTFATL